MSKKLRVAILFGGQSAEHEVSVQSARNVMGAINLSKYSPVLIGIDRNGSWYLNEPNCLALESKAENILLDTQKGTQVIATYGNGIGSLMSIDNASSVFEIDVMFPLLHGVNGEDGSVQGLAKLANIPCVGSGILSSSIGMDKDFTKRLLRQAEIPVAKDICVRHEAPLDIEQKVAEELSYPVFVKPANSGSSVGVTKVNQPSELKNAIDYALQYDLKVLIEERILGQEIECAVLGNEAPKASTVGAILPREDGFYSYEKKYLDDNGAVLQIPVELKDEVVQAARQLAIKVYRTLECKGMARVDMFLKEDHSLVVNEANTLPGFTSISMYPKLWQASGLTYTDLIDQLITLALDDHKNRAKLKITH